MRNKLWILSAGIILLNFSLVLGFRHILPAELPLHIALDGTYDATMPYARLFFYPATSLVLAAAIYLLAGLAFKKIKSMNDARGIRATVVDVLVCGLTLIILCSTCVALTLGKNHFFMFAEPVIFLLIIAAAVIGELRIRNSR